MLELLQNLPYNPYKFMCRFLYTTKNLLKKYIYYVIYVAPITLTSQFIITSRGPARCAWLIFL